MRLFVSRFLLAIAVASLAAGAAAQDKKEFQPQIGQQGKDVIWVPTPDESSSACCAWRRPPPATT